MNQQIDFTQPQRLNFFGVFVSGIKFFLRFIRAFGIAFLFILIKNSSMFFSGWFWLGLLGIFVLIMLFAYLNYLNFWYYIDPVNKEFIIKRGILNKERVVIKFDKILQINIVQNVIQQALDLYSVEVESSGSKETEIDLFALDEETAQSLKNYILVLKGDLNTDFQQNESYIEDQQELLFELKAKDIFVVSLFSNYRQGMLLFFAFLITIFNQVSEYLFQDGLLAFFEDFSVTLLLSQIAIILFVILLVPILINLVRYFITYYNFQMNRSKKGVLNMHYGLFNLKDLIFNRDKVQLITSTQNWVLKKFKLSIVTLQQVLTDEQKVESSLIHLPGITDSDKTILYGILFDRNLGTKFQTYLPSIRLFVSRTIKVFLVFIALAAIGFIAFRANFMEIACACGFLFLLVSLYNFLFYRNYKLLQYDDFIIRKAGVWDIKETIVPIKSVNAVSVSQTFWQVRRKLGNVGLSTSSGVIDFVFFDLNLMNSLANEILYRIEKESFKTA
ncbi:PH domain-containing protein [Sphingobacterium hungaricum]|uniref:YdbS-like PH domain-containing protein n=1 Tax=Sphingobacterium hungaricum TaxID=2082723 RepID=A0A928UYM2_9SPHI|nr:PH domain-containing protein [Sphingobacterium hungaricum]MBE8713795.1 hypothetical protein [Sphingobacterium hungaricum]